ncbi:hypothetical protein JN00_0167 [Metamycoplasma subdolum]|uniref:Uncharacterized protein n=1 Tax=Metamycoplasma subdolum TaxID=92407 RepID=A0A3M0A9Q4_9BACT|nr:hypothetical protein [Metamycoplasma subdolum]RMA79115.1 hypothetical protein JN00_0167 [Metamycoplasma subdolum]WPB50638.1 hypothetical protein R9C05_00555 [Metamycoplasma subdolum]
MKDTLNKRHWVIFFTLNLVMLLGYITVSYFNYSLVIGHLAGVVSFLFFSLSISLLFRENKQKEGEKSIKKTKSIKVVLFLLIALVNTLIIFGCAGLNYLLRTQNPYQSIGFWPINLITFATPYTLILISAIVEIVLVRLDRKKGKEDGQIAQT